MRKTLIVVVGAVLALSTGAIAAAQSDVNKPSSGRRQTNAIVFKSQRPGSSTATAIRTVYFNPDKRRFDPRDPTTKPPATRLNTPVLADGAHIDPRVPGQCNASDAQLIAQGASACPGSSRVGGGVVEIDTGFPAQRREPPRVMTFDVTLLNTSRPIAPGDRGQMIFLNRDRASGTRNVTRARIVNARTIQVLIPPAPGTPPDGGALLTVRLDLANVVHGRGAGQGGYVTTPPRCPASGRFINAETFRYTDGVAQTVKNGSPCSVGSTSQGRRRLIRGTNGDDRIVCPSGDNLVEARGGDDVVLCGSGNDVIHGGSGDDRLYGGSGDDRIFGESGNDRLEGNSGNDRLVGGPGNDRFSEGTGRDTTSP